MRLRPGNEPQVIWPVPAPLSRVQPFVAKHLRASLQPQRTFGADRTLPFMVGTLTMWIKSYGIRRVGNSATGHTEAGAMFPDGRGRGELLRQLPPLTPPRRDRLPQHVGRPAGHHQRLRPGRRDRCRGQRRPAVREVGPAGGDPRRRPYRVPGHHPDLRPDGEAVGPATVQLRGGGGRLARRSGCLSTGLRSSARR